jgi:hypothetical protein
MAYITTGTRTDGPNQQPPYTRDVGGQSEHDLHEEKVTAEVLAGGTSLEVIAGAAAVVLSIIGLTGYLPGYMAAISVLAIGGALMAHGSAMAARWRDEVRRVSRGRITESELAGGVATEVFGGAAGVALGILALAHIMPLLLLSIAVIVEGGSILFGGSSQFPLAQIGEDFDRRATITRDAVQAGGGVMARAGCAAIVLGILGVIHVGPQTILILVSTLAIGGGLVLGAGALTGVFARRARAIHA